MVVLWYYLFMNDFEKSFVRGDKLDASANMPTDSMVTDVIFDVELSGLKILREFYFGWLIFASVAGVLLAIAGVALFVITNKPFNPRIVFLIIAPILVLPGMVVAVARGRALPEFFKQFARANGYSYQSRVSPDVCSAYFSAYGSEKSVMHYVNGVFMNHHLALFLYSFATGSGKSRRSFTSTVFKVNFSGQVPEILLRPQLFSWTADVGSFGGRLKNKLPVPVEFDKVFDLYAKKDYEIEALQIFDPAFMAKLVSDYKGVSIEFFGNDVYIFYDHVIGKKVELEHAFELAKYFIEKLQPKLAKMHGGVHAMKERFDK